MGITSVMKSYSQAEVQRKAEKRNFSLLEKSTNAPMMTLPNSLVLDEIAVNAGFEDKVAESRLFSKIVSYQHKNGAIVEFNQIGMYPLSSVSMIMYDKDKTKLDEAEKLLREAFIEKTDYSLFNCAN